MTAGSPERGQVVVVGSLNVDHVVQVERLARPGETVIASREERLAGGKGANQAVAAVRAGATVTMVGAVGDDDGGRAYRRRLAERGIRTSLATVVDRPTGHAFISVDAAGENAIVVVPGANGSLGVADLGALDDLRPQDVLLVQLEVPLPVVAAAVRRAAGRGARVVLNCAPYAALPADVVALADPLVCNEHEARLFAQAGVAPASWLVTFGAAGCTWDGEQFTAPVVPPEDVIDTVGAGDAFCGALAAALAAGAGRAEAVAAAMSAGAAAVCHAGAQPQAELPLSG